MKKVIFVIVFLSYNIGIHGQCLSPMDEMLSDIVYGDTFVYFSYKVPYLYEYNYILLYEHNYSWYCIFMDAKYSNDYWTYTKYDSQRILIKRELIDSLFQNSLMEIDEIEKNMCEFSSGSKLSILINIGEIQKRLIISPGTATSLLDMYSSSLFTLLSIGSLSSNNKCIKNQFICKNLY